MEKPRIDRPMNVSRYLVTRLSEAGIGHAFGVPGDYTLDFLDHLLDSPIRWVGTCNELNAGYAADGYARLAGAGLAVVTYAVGGFSILNAVAGAYAESVPLIVVSGAPPGRVRAAGALVHHLVGDFMLQVDVFRRFTAATAFLDDATTAPAEIDRVLGAALAARLPGYIEIPMDVARTPCDPPGPMPSLVPPASDFAALAEAVAEAVDQLDRARSPVVLVGVEALRFGLAAGVLSLVERVELPFATTTSSKAALPELHPQFVGLYQGALSRPEVRQQLEESDCVLALGVKMTDWDTGMFTMGIDPARMIRAGVRDVAMRSHVYPGVGLGDFVRALSSAVTPRRYELSHPRQAVRVPAPFVPIAGAAISSARFFERLATFLDDSMTIVSDVSDVLCGASDLHVQEADRFLCQAYYCSIGWSVPAALGAALARPDRRPVVLVGDGAFQMTAQEVSTLMREKTRAIVFVLDNDGYLIERLLHDDGAYNDVQRWRYADLPAVFGEGAVSFRVTTEGELEAALAAARAETEKVVFVHLSLPGREPSAGLARLCAAYREKMAGRRP